MMKLKEKYKVLQDQSFARRMVVSSVFGSMELEDQGIDRRKIRAMYDRFRREKAASLVRESL